MKALTLSVLLSLASVIDARAQGGCSDAGVCTLGGHSTDMGDPSHRYSVGLVQTYAFTKDYTYFETIPSFGYDFDVVRAEFSFLFRASSAKYELETHTKSGAPAIPKLPSVQHVTIESNSVESHYAIGDAKLALTFPLDFIDDRIALNTAYTYPLTALYEDRPQEMQSTIGVPGLLLGLSYDDGDRSLSYGGTLAYQTTFNRANSLHLIRADDLALAGRLRVGINEKLSLGFDMSAIYHLADDQLHHIPTSEIIGYETTKGLTLNIGGSASYKISESFGVSAFLAAPIASIAHVDGLKRAFVSGLALGYSF